MRFFKYFVLIFLLFFICESVICQNFDQYGGNKILEGTRTGNWHTEKIKGRYWFVTPEGNGMYVLGINHIDASNDYEKEGVVENLRKWHFNSGGYGIPEWLLDDFPGFIHVSLHDAVHWLTADQFNFTDVFSREFEDKVKEIIKEATSIARDNTNVIGYSLTDTPRYSLDIIRSRRGNDWVSYIRKLPANAEGKQQYVEFLKDCYNDDFDNFKTDYRLEKVHSWDDLLSNDFDNLELTRSAIRRDDEAFIVKIAEKIYQLTKKYFDLYDPDALLLSEKFKIHDHPEKILKLAGIYFDIISIQPGPTHGPDVGQGPDESTFDPTYWQYLHELTGKPVFVTDHGFAFYTPEYPRTLWHQFHSEESAADFYDWYVKQVIQEPYIIGYMKCQYKNRYDPLRTLLKQGIIKMDLSPYPTLEEQIIKTNQAVFKQLYK